MTKKLLKPFAVLTFIICSMSLSAQDVDLISSVNVTPPLSVGQTFTYTIATNPNRPYRGVQVYLNYNNSVIQLNSLTPDNSLLVFTFANDTATPGVIRFASGSLTNINSPTTVFTAEFEVISTAESVMIEHDLFSSGTNANGTAVTNSAGNDITGTTNDIILATLSVEQPDFSSGISVFPNPVNDVFNIKLNTSNTEIDNIKVYSIEGKLIQQYNDVSSTNDLIKLDTSQFERAMYFVTITSTNNELATFKMVVN